MKTSGVLVGAVAAVVTLFAALQGPQAPNLIIGVSGDPLSLDLTNARGSVGRSIASLIVEPLVTRSEELRIIPFLAERWVPSTLPDGRWRVEFWLRRGVRFDRGEILNATDATATIDANCGIKDFGRVNALSREHFEIVFPRAFSSIFPNLTVVGIRPAHAVGDPRFDLKPNGTGPYRLERYTLGAEIALEARPIGAYWGMVPGVDRVTFRVISDERGRLDALRRGVIHLATDVTPGSAAALLTVPDIGTTSVPTTRLIHIQMRTDRAPFSDPRVRRAVALAIDRSRLVTQATHAFGEVATSYFHPRMLGFVRQPAYKVDPDRAKRLLAEGGYNLPLPATLGYARDLTWNADRVAEFVAEQLGRAGFSITLERLETGSTIAQLSRTEKRHDLVLFAASNQTLDPQASLDPFKPAMNFMGYSDARVARLIEESGSRVAEQAVPLYRRLQELLWQDVVWLPLYYEPQIVAWNRRLEGVTLRPDGLIPISRIRFRR